MSRGDITLEKQLCIAVFLGDIVIGCPEGVGRIVPRAVQHQRQAAVGRILEHIGVFPLSFIAVGGDADAIIRDRGVRMAVAAHAACALVAQYAYAQLRYPTVRDVCPAIHGVVLTYARHIHESVAVAVMLALAILEVQQQGGGQFVIEVDAAVDIGFDLQLRVKIRIGTHPVGTLRLKEFDINLSGNALVSVFDTRRTFGDLY